MGGLKKRGPKHKKRKYRENRDQSIGNNEPIDEDDFFKKLMEDAPTYRRHNGAIKQVRHG